MNLNLKFCLCISVHSVCKTQHFVIQVNCRVFWCCADGTFTLPGRYQTPIDNYEGFGDDNDDYGDDDIDGYDDEDGDRCLLC